MSSNAGKEAGAHPPVSLGEIEEMYKQQMAEIRFKAQFTNMDKSKIVQEGELLTEKGEALFAQAEEGAGIVAVSTTMKLVNSARNSLQKARVCFDKWEELDEVQTARFNINPEIVERISAEEIKMSQNNDTV